jgi:hypothetical protein
LDPFHVGVSVGVDVCDTSQFRWECTGKDLRVGEGQDGDDADPGKISNLLDTRRNNAMRMADHQRYLLTAEVLITPDVS